MIRIVYLFLDRTLMKYIPKYCIVNYEGKVLVRTTDHSLKLISIPDENLINEKDVCYFNSEESAENYIWKHEFLEIDPTLRAFQI